MAQASCLFQDAFCKECRALFFERCAQHVALLCCACRLLISYQHGSSIFLCLLAAGVRACTHVLQLTLGNSASGVNFDTQHLKPGPCSVPGTAATVLEHCPATNALTLSKVHAATLAYLWLVGAYDIDAKPAILHCLKQNLPVASRTDACVEELLSTVGGWKPGSPMSKEMNTCFEAWHPGDSIPSACCRCSVCCYVAVHRRLSLLTSILLFYHNTAGKLSMLGVYHWTQWLLDTKVAWVCDVQVF